MVTTWFPTPSHPSVGSFVVKDATAIAESGHDVRVVHLVPGHQHEGLDLSRGAGQEDHAGLGVTRIPMTPGRPDQVALAARRLRGISSYADVVHTVAISSLLPMAWWRPRAPWVHTEHWSGLTAPETLGAPLRAALPGIRALHLRPDVVTAVCDYLADPIRRMRQQRSTHVVPCIVPVPTPVPPRRAPDGTLRLVGIGGLIDRKDPLLALEVLAALVAHGSDAHLTLVGEGPLRPKVQAKAGALGLTGRVRLTGTLDGAGVAAELAAADLFLGPTRGDNFFVSCAEALVAGRPVVVGSTGGQGEYIDPAVGELIDTQDADRYAAAVLQVLDRTSYLSAQDISDTIGDRFSPVTVAAGYDRAYQRAVAVHEASR